MVLTDTTTKARNQNRKAIAMAETLRALNLDHFEAGRLSDHGWQLCARAAWLALPEDQRPATPWADASWETRRLVVDQLEIVPTTADTVFAAIANGVPASMRP